MMRVAVSSWLIAALPLWVLGCGPASFQPVFKPPVAPTERVVLGQLTQQPPRDERPVAVGVTSDPQRLFAFDLSAGLLWERPVHAKSAPLVAGNAVVLREGAGIVVRDLGSGEVRAVVDETGDLVGADGQGRSVVVAISYGDGDPRGAVAYVDGNRVRWKQPLKLPVGVPALAGDYVLVPWATQRLSALSAKNGAELTRWHFNKTVLGQALVDHGHVYVGQHALMRVDQTLLEQPDKANPGYAPLRRELPGQPPFLRDGYTAVPEPENAYHRLQLEFRIGEHDGVLGAENGTLLLRFYRLLFALDAQKDEIHWVRTFDHDLVGAATQPGGWFVADSAGVLRFVDLAGETRMQRDLGRPVQVVTIRPGAWIPAAASPGAGAPATVSSASMAARKGSAGEAPLPTLREQLFAAAALEDDRLSAGRAYAVEHLALIPDAAVTAHLIELCSNRKSPEPVQSAACKHLAGRENGGNEVLRALARRASFLDNTTAPPVGALAKAAALMKLQKAGPLLVSQMEDPNTSARDLAALFDALEKLDHHAAGSAIERFVRLHHAEPAGSEVQPALYAAVHALGALHARSSRASLQDVAQDALTPQGLRDKAAEALALLDAKPTPSASAKQDPTPKAEPEPEAEQQVTDPRPYALTPEMVRAGLWPVHKALSACVAADPSKPRSGRISMVVQGEGRVEGIFVTPTTLQACMEPIVREARFAATRAGRQRISQVIYGPNAAPPAKAKRHAARKHPAHKPATHKPAAASAPPAK